MMERQTPPTRSLLTSGDLRIAFERTPDGIRLKSLFDTATERELLSALTLPLFTLKLRHCETKKEIQLNADAGWAQVAIESTPSGAELRWQGPKALQEVAAERSEQEPPTSSLEIVARATLDNEASAVRWQLRVENKSSHWSIWRVVFPQVAVAELGEEASVFFPRGPGEVQKGLWRRPFRHPWCRSRRLRRLPRYSP